MRPKLVGLNKHSAFAIWVIKCQYFIHFEYMKINFSKNSTFWQGCCRWLEWKQNLYCWLWLEKWNSAIENWNSGCSLSHKICFHWKTYCHSVCGTFTWTLFLFDFLLFGSKNDKKILLFIFEVLIEGLEPMSSPKP